MVDWNRRAHIAESILDTACMTPMVRLRRVVGDVKPAIVAKIEYFNPSGSVKDRILHFLVSEAERRGDLRRGHRDASLENGPPPKRPGELRRIHSILPLLIVDDCQGFLDPYAEGYCALCSRATARGYSRSR